jgi:hypothetical protein
MTNAKKNPIPTTTPYPTPTGRGVVEAIVVDLLGAETVEEKTSKTAAC